MRKIAEAVQPGTPIIIGFPFDAYSSFLHGAAEAPPAIRLAFLSPSSNMWTETGLDLGQEGSWVDYGDVPLIDTARAFDTIEAVIAEALQHQLKPLVLGGDHAITYPIMRAVAQTHRPLTILHFDAHGDLYDEYEGNRFSHACPFARIMEDGLATRLVQVGIRTLNDHQRDQIKRFGVEVIEMRQFERAKSLRFDTPVYISFDVDGLDPAFAPGVSHPEAGGFSTRQSLEIIQAINTPVIGADLVELNPRRDVGGITAAACAKLLKEIIGMMKR